MRRIEQVATDVKLFTLVPIYHKLPAFRPGAHVQTVLETPIGALKRHYSLCSPAEAKGFYQIAIKRAASSRGATAFWHEEVRPGTTLWISQPVNHLSLSQVARHHVFVAGGIGITPFLPMMLELQSLGKSFELHYAAKTPDACAFYHRLQDQYPEQSHFYFSALHQRVTPQVLEHQKVGTHLYLCGPQSLIREFQSAARHLGYPSYNIHIEAFTAADRAENFPFQVELKRSGALIDVSCHQTLLQALQDVGIQLPYSCQVGGCGTCELQVLEGEVDHRDFYLTETEQQRNRSIIACVSRARGQVLKLDL